MRTHYCGELRAAHIGERVTLCGWVHHRRDHGGVIFIDLRDREGVAQVVCDPDTPQAFAAAEAVRSEYVLRVEGVVRHRPQGTVNPALPTGEVEVLAERLEVLNEAHGLPFLPDEHQVGEELRLRYRYLDLRRAAMQANLRLRARLTASIRSWLDDQGFIEVETPILTRSTPEGARDYVVPSRTHPGRFFALPQSPQLFKQLLMMGGLDRYYQIARCFRDEDLRADRQPEFTQLDVETAFLDADAITGLMESLMRHVFREVAGIELEDPFPRLTYAEAMARFGTDRPDLRVPLELQDVADLMRDVEFKVFAGPAADPRGRVAVLRAPGAGERLTRSQIDGYGEFVGRYGAKGLAWIRVNDPAAGASGLQSPIVKFLPEPVLAALMERTGAGSGDLLFFGAGPATVVNDSMAALRLKLGEDLGLVAPGWRPLWVTGFPMFEWDEREGRWQSLHHPFTAPDVEDPEALVADPGAALSRAYDMVLNGVELGGGSERVHHPAMQQAVFRVLGIDEAEARDKFGFLLEALRYGCPPHGGIAFGLDRIAMLMAGAGSIREVIAFPKTQSAACPLTGAPAPIEERQLRELGLRLRVPPQGGS